MLLVILSGIETADERDLFESVYYRYRNLLFCVAKNIVSNDADAEDVLQNAFIKISQNLDCIDTVEGRKTCSFLIVITKNTAYDFLRKRKNEALPLEEVGEREFSDNSFEQTVINGDYKVICKCISELPQPYNEALYFHYVYDFSVKKTAQLLGRKTATVKMQLVRGKRLLLSKLQEAGL